MAFQFLQKLLHCNSWQLVPIYISNLFLNLSRFSILNGILRQEKLTAQSSILHRTEGKQPFTFTIVLSPIVSCLFLQITKKAKQLLQREDYHREYRTFTTFKYDILRLTSSLGSSFWCSLPIKRAPVARRSCYVASPRHAAHSVFFPFYSCPMSLPDFGACQTLPTVSRVFLYFFGYDLLWIPVFWHSESCWPLSVINK